MSRNFYQILGVDRSVTDAQLKKAYRKLALRFHPDRNRGKEAEAAEKFKELSTAYECLLNKQKRQIYDEYGEAGLQRGFRPPVRPKPPGASNRRSPSSSSSSSSQSHSQQQQTTNAYSSGNAYSSRTKAQPKTQPNDDPWAAMFGAATGSGKGMYDTVDPEAADDIAEMFRQLFGTDDRMDDTKWGVSAEERRGPGLDGLGSLFSSLGRELRGGKKEGDTGSGRRIIRPNEAEDPTVIPCGARVVVQGLTAAKQFNAHVGTVTGYDKKKSRYLVSVGESTLALRWVNMTQMIDVRMKGIQSKPALNGQIGTIVSYDDDMARYKVMVGRQTLALKPDCVVLPSGTRVHVFGLGPRTAQHNNKCGMLEGFDGLRYTLNMGNCRIKLKPSHCVC